MEKTQLLLTDFIHQDKSMLYNAKQIYLPDEKKSLLTKINEYNKILTENKQLKEEMSNLQDRLTILEKKIAADLPSTIPSWADATPAQISSILTQYYNGDINLDDIPWQIGDKKYITYETTIESTITTRHFILTILDKNKFSNAFVIGLQCKGRPIDETNVLTSLDLLAGIRTFPSGLSYNSNLNLFYWSYSTSEIWKESSFNDEQTINAFQVYYNNSQDLNSILALKRPSTFNNICDTQRTLIPCPNACVIPETKNTLQFFNNHLKDYALLVKNSENGEWGYGSILDYEEYSFDFLGYFTARNISFNAANTTYSSYSLLLFCL